MNSKNPDKNKKNSLLSFVFSLIKKNKVTAPKNRLSGSAGGGPVKGY